MSCKVTYCYCTLIIIFVLIFFCLWLGKVIGIILIENENQLLWKIKKKYFAQKKNILLITNAGQPAGPRRGLEKWTWYYTAEWANPVHTLRTKMRDGPKRTRKVNLILHCGTGQPDPLLAFYLMNFCIIIPFRTWKEILIVTYFSITNF